ncbi:hypothetical protein Tco_0241658 [Tanacetum coccineum]
MIQETTEKIVLIKQRIQAAQDRQKSYADLKQKPIEFKVGDWVMLKVSPWKGVVRFGKQGKLNPRYVGPFKVLAKKYYADEPLVMSLEGIHVDDKLQFVEELVEIMEREIKQLKRSRIPLIKTQSCYYRMVRLLPRKSIPILSSDMKRNFSRNNSSFPCERNFYAKDNQKSYEYDENNDRITHNHWDTSATRDETSRNISSTTTTESPEVVRQLEMMNKNFVEMMRQIQTIKSIDTKCETCAVPHSFTECPAADGYTQEAAYAITAPNNQGRGQNFNQGNNNYQAPNFQAPNYQAQVGPSNELTNYIKSNEATLRAMQTHMTNMKTKLRNEFKSTIDARTNKIENQNNQIMNILTNMQNQNSSGSGSFPSNTIANPRGDVKANTTRSGVAYDGPTIPPTPSPLLKEVERETEMTKDKVQNTSLGSTAHVQPSIVQDPITEPEVAPKPKPKPLIPYPSRLNDQKLREKANNQMLKFLQIFQRLHFDISFADALYINAELSLTGTHLRPRMTRERRRTDRHLIREGVAEDIFVIRRKFYFPADFVVWLIMISDPLGLPLNLGRPFLRTARVLIDVYGEELTLRVNDEAITFKVGQTSRYSDNYKTVNQVNVIDVACKKCSDFHIVRQVAIPLLRIYPSSSSSHLRYIPFEGG